MDVIICDNKYIPNPLHELTSHVSQPAKMSYEKSLRIQKECYWPHDFCEEANMLARDVICALFILEP